MPFFTTALNTEKYVSFLEYRIIKSKQCSYGQLLTFMISGLKRNYFLQPNAPGLLIHPKDPRFQSHPLFFNRVSRPH